ncbi:prefoldin subunit domain-containing protein [Ditylenchus destructor]|uniref:Prefoldin subunit 3 n=1 Tax=Ditylenchus destructor TaxID=166010 RepID=A0AAD4R2B6_9BILA|nr:prefoldin subunit domain-containing protein [Ditylenchus destructor]
MSNSEAAESSAGDSSKVNLSVEERMERKGIPKAPVLENVEEYLAEKKMNVDEATENVKEDFRKYKMVEESFIAQRDKMAESITDYKKSLAALKMLEEQKKADRNSVEITYKLDENIYSKAVVDDFSKVCVWLGANVMVEYGLEEAQEMLSKNLENIEKVNTDLEEELDFIRDQITTTEVNVAHLYNHNVQQKKLITAANKTD